MTTKTLTKTEDIVTVIVQDVAVKFDKDGKECQEWEVLFPWSKFPQRMMIWEPPGVMPAKGERLPIAVKRGGRRGNGDGSLERDYWWNFDGFPDPKPLPPAGTPTDPDPFPVAGATKERPVATPSIPPAHSAPQTPPTPQPKPETRPSPVASAFAYSRTFNLGSFESERFELTVDAPPGWSDAEVYAHIQERIARARGALPSDTSARAAEREGRPL